MNESRHEPIIGIDSAYDEPNKEYGSPLDPRILRLSFLITMYITEHMPEITSSYCSLIMYAAKNIQPASDVISIQEYADYVLEISFAYAGRKHYDDLSRLVKDYLADEVGEDEES